MKKLLLTMALCLTALLLVVGTAAAAVPEVTSTDVAYVAFGKTGDGTTADTPIGTLAGAAELLPDGGTLVVTNKLYIATEANLPAMSGALKITAKQGAEDFTGVSGNALIIEGSSKTVGVLTINSDVIIDDIAISMRNKKIGTIKVSAGATLYVGDNVTVNGKDGWYPAIVLDGGTAILNAGTFSRVTGHGTLINNGATIAGAVLPEVTADAKAYIAFNGNDSNDGASADTPKKTIGATTGSGAAALIKDGGTLVVSQKLLIGSDYSWNMSGVAKITANDGTKDYQIATPATNPASGVMKFGSGKKLTLKSSLILDDLILFQEGATANTIVVDNGATLVIGSKVNCMTKQSFYMNIVVNAGGAVILNGGTFQSVTGEGSIFNNGATIVDHEHTQAGIVTKEATTTETGHVKYACSVCGYAMGEDELPVLPSTPAAVLTLQNTSAAIYSTDNATVRYIVKLDVEAGAAVESYGIMIAQTAETVNAKSAVLTDAFEGTTTYAVDLVNIPKDAFGTSIYAWAYVNLAGGVRIVLPIDAVTVNGIIG